jgi:hypothetical protein
MKRKLFITLTLCLFAVGAVITTNVAQNDISLEDIRVMAKADYTKPSVVSHEHLVSERYCDGIKYYFCRENGYYCNVSAQPVCPGTDQ